MVDELQRPTTDLKDFIRCIKARNSKEVQSIVDDFFIGNAMIELMNDTHIYTLREISTSKLKPERDARAETKKELCLVLDVGKVRKKNGLFCWCALAKY